MARGRAPLPSQIRLIFGNINVLSENFDVGKNRVGLKIL